MTSDISGEAPARTLDDAHLSRLVIDADRAAAKAQTRFVEQSRLHTFLLVAAAAAGAFSVHVGGLELDWAGVIAAVAFAASMVVRSVMERQQDARAWYEFRAAAESAKTLCWRFATGGDPFPVTLSDDDAAGLVIRRQAEVLRSLQRASALDLSGAAEISEEMWAVRRSPWAERVAAYVGGRLRNQCQWYSAKAEFNRARARLWFASMLAIELTGLVVGVLKAVDVISIDLLGVCAAVAAAFGSWLQLRQHQSLAAAYAVAANELQVVLALAPTVSEQEWPAFVVDAEEAISREHTTWRASQGAS